ncbi:MAG: hypothetical protein LBB12_00980 [Holosporaceae bacterium]|jgi:hypothetical protein|nr:hypothetical protein [Holosporaceae bacterium]
MKKLLICSLVLCPLSITTSNAAQDYFPSSSGDDHFNSGLLKPFNNFPTNPSFPKFPTEDSMSDQEKTMYQAYKQLEQEISQKNNEIIMGFPDFEELNGHELDVAIKAEAARKEKIRTALITSFLNNTPAVFYMDRQTDCFAGFVSLQDDMYYLLVSCIRNLLRGSSLDVVCKEMNSCLKRICCPFGARMKCDESYLFMSTLIKNKNFMNFIQQCVEKIKSQLLAEEIDFSQSVNAGLALLAERKKDKLNTKKEINLEEIVQEGINNGSIKRMYALYVHNTLNEIEHICAKPLVFNNNEETNYWVEQIYNFAPDIGIYIGLLNFGTMNIMKSIRNYIAGLSMHDDRFSYFAKLNENDAIFICPLNKKFPLISNFSNI